MSKCTARGAGYWVACALALGLGIALVAAATAEEAKTTDKDSMGGYTRLRMDEVGLFVGGFDGRIDSMSDGVKITLLSDDPDKKPLPIAANQMKFTWPKEGGKRPSRIVLEGKVVIEHPQAVIKSDKADWDFEKGFLTFTGSPVMTNEQMPDGMQAQKIVLDFNENRFQVFGGHAKEMRFGDVGAEKEAGASAPGAAGDPSLLGSKDVTDWTAFMTRIKADGASASPSPGKRIVSLLDPKAQKQISTVPVETLLQGQGAVLKQINRVLTNPKLYDAEAWKGVELSPEAQGLLQNAPAGKDLARLNRLLLEAAFPALIAKSAK